MYSVLGDIIVGFFGLFGGLAISYLYFRCSPAAQPQPPREAPQAGAPPAMTSPDAAANDAARTQMAAQQLRDLAQCVASDVDAHTSAIGSMTSELTSHRDGGGDLNAVVVDVIARMLMANEHLQARLEDAEQKIQAQADEIRVQQSEARTDSLTGLANRRAFDDCLAENSAALTRGGRPFSLLLLDIDNFKKFNDAHGHLAGDEALRSIGQTLTRFVKGGDFPCRYGGEEFAIIMPATTIADGRSAAERLRRAIERTPVVFEGDSYGLTASFGVAECGREELTKHLFRRADDCVYESKQAGRNCGHWHTGTERLKITAEAPPAVSSSASTELKLPNVSPQAAPASRQVFGELLSRRIAETHRTGAPLSVLCFRIDHFVELEATYGAAVCGVVLQWLNSYIRSSLRDMDSLGLGNVGELVAMLPGSTESATRIVGQRIATSVSSFPIPLGHEQIRLDVRFGLASVGPGDQAADAIGRARAETEAAADTKRPEIVGAPA